MSTKASKEKILGVTMDMLVRLPMEEVTVREIAKIAGVNIASIHYYYSSKEILFNAAIDKIIVKSINEWMEQNSHAAAPSSNDLIKFIEFLHIGALDHREFAKSRIRNTLNLDQVNTANVMVYETIFKLAKKLNLESDTKKLKLKVSLIYSSLASISGSPDDMMTFTGLKLVDNAKLKLYIRQIIKIIFSKDL
jgi:AcrR family transcriptional regulator